MTYIPRYFPSFFSPKDDLIMCNMTHVNSPDLLEIKNDLTNIYRKILIRQLTKKFDIICYRIWLKSLRSLEFNNNIHCTIGKCFSGRTSYLFQDKPSLIVFVFLTIKLCHENYLFLAKPSFLYIYIYMNYIVKQMIRIEQWMNLFLQI